MLEKLNILFFYSALAFFLQLTACETKEEKTAFLNIGSEQEQSGSDADMSTLLSSVKTELLASGEELLESEPIGIEFFCSRYSEQSKTERLGFWSKTVYKIIQTNDQNSLSLLQCDGPETRSVELAFCVAASLNEGFGKLDLESFDLLQKALAKQVRTLQVCN